MSRRWERIVQQGEQFLRERAFSDAAKNFEKALREAEINGDVEMRAESLQLLAMARLECGSKAQAEEQAKCAAEITKGSVVKQAENTDNACSFLQIC